MAGIRLQELLADYPDNLTAMNLLAETHMAQGETAKAQAPYQAIIAVAPYQDALQRNPEANAFANDLAMLFADHFADDDARASAGARAHRELRLLGTDALLDTAGRFQYRSGNDEQAAVLLEEAVSNAPETAPYRHRLGIAHSAAGCPDEGKPLLKGVVAHKPPVPKAEHARAALRELLLAVLETLGH